MEQSRDAILLGVVICLCSYVQAADVNYLRDTIVGHFSENRHHLVNMTNKNAAKKFIFSEFQRFGLDTEYNSFFQPPIQTVFNNVIGVLKGTRFGTAQDKIIGVGAHYDTVETTKGVDDNGSGVAALLEAARQITQMNVRQGNTIIFAAFDLKETDIIGSQKFIDTWLYPWLASNYGAAAAFVQSHGVIVLDTLMEYNTSQNSQMLPAGLDVQTNFPDTYASISSDGFKGDFLTLIYRGPTRDAGLANIFQKVWKSDDRDQFEIEALSIPATDIYTTRQFRDVMRDLYTSDHTSFWFDDIPAIYITDTTNLRGDMQYCYHEMCDDVETMVTDDNINFLGKTADVIVQTVHSLSDPGSLSDPENGAEKVYQSTCHLFFLSVVALLITSG